MKAFPLNSASGFGIFELNLDEFPAQGIIIDKSCNILIIYFAIGSYADLKSSGQLTLHDVDFDL